MRHGQLKLVVPNNVATTATDDTTELPSEPARPDSGMARLRLVDRNDVPPDDAA
jgi:hypothetical protein